MGIKGKYQTVKQELADFALSHGLIPARKDFRRFIILGMGRCGTNLLASSLRSHRNIISFGEIFNNADHKRILWEYPGYVNTSTQVSLREEKPIEFIDKSVFKPMPRHIAALGFKLFYYHAREENWSCIWPYLRSSDISIIHVKRKNLLALQLSMSVAMRTKKWSTRSGTPSQKQNSFELPYDQCLNAFETISRWQDEADGFFDGKNRMTLFYEDLVKNYPAAMESVQSFLNVQIRPTSTPLKKQAKLPLHQSISNYNDLKERFSGSKWEHFFEQ